MLSNYLSAPSTKFNFEMKKYTAHFLIVTIISGLLGFTGLEYPGAMLVRLICLFAGIGLMISCLDAVIVIRKNRKNVKAEKVKSDSDIFSF